MTEPLNIVMATLACWRLTDLIVADRILAGVRARWPHYFWTCSRCVSVWTGALAVAALIYMPWLNLPFALSQLSILAHWVIQKYDRAGLVTLKQEGEGLRLDLGGLDKSTAASMVKRAHEALKNAA